MMGSALGETMNVLWGPGLVLLVIIIWLIRRVIRAARTESQLEEERLREWMKGEVAQLQSSKGEPRLMRVPPAAERQKTLAAARQAAALSSPPQDAAPVAPVPPLEGTLAQGPPVIVPDDMNGVTASELDAIRPLFGDGDGAVQPRLLWVRSSGSHIAFCERREPTPPSTLVRDVITVVKIAGGKVVGKWQFG